MSRASSQASAWPDGLASPSQAPDADTRAFLSAMADAHAAEAAGRASDAKASSRPPTDDEPPPFSLVRSGTTPATAATEDSPPTPLAIRGEDDDAEAVEAAVLLISAALTIEPAVLPTEAPPAAPTDASTDASTDALSASRVSIDSESTTTVTTTVLSSAAGLRLSLTENPPSPEPIKAGDTSALTTDLTEHAVAIPSLPISLPTSSTTPSDTAAAGTSGSSSDIQYPAAASLPKHARALLQALKEQNMSAAGLPDPTVAAPLVVPRLAAASPESPAPVVTAIRETGVDGSSAGASPRVTAVSTDSFSARSVAAAALAAAPLFTEPSTPGSNAGQRDSREQSLRERETLPTLAGSKAAPAVELFSLVEQRTPSDLGAIEAPDLLRPAGHLPNEDAVAATLVRSMQLQYRNGVGTAVVNLDPEYLGAVTIALQVERGVVTATLHAANAEVRGWMQANESTLRQGLAEQGLSLDRLIVSEEERHGEQPSEDGRRRPSQEEERQRRQSHRGDTRTFEVIV